MMFADLHGDRGVFMANLPMKGPLMRQIFGAATYRATKPTETGSKNLSAPHLASRITLYRALQALECIETITRGLILCHRV